MSTISASTTSTTAFKITTDTTGALVFQTGSSPTTAVTIDGSQRAAFVAGTAAAPAITTSGDTDTGIYFPAANTLAFSTSGTEDARFDSAGNFGLGVTPSAWASGVRAFEQPNGTALVNLGNLSQTILTSNTYYNNSGQYIYKNTAAAAYYHQNSGAHYWYTAGSGTAGNAITFTQAMTLDGSGNLGLGVTPSAWGSSFKSIDVNAYTSFYGTTNNAYSGFSQNAYYNGTNWIYRNTNAASNYIQSGGTHVWQTAGSGTAGNTISLTTAMTLDASGNLGVGTTSPSSYGKFAVIYTDYSFGAFGTTNGTAVTMNLGSNSVTQASYIGTVTNHPFIIQTNSTERARLDTSGNLIVGRNSTQSGTTGGQYYDATGFPIYLATFNAPAASFAGTVKRICTRLGETGDPALGYVLLCKAYQGGATQATSIFSGCVYRLRGSAGAFYQGAAFQVTVGNAYNQNGYGGVNFGSLPWQIVTCTVSSVIYLAVRCNATYSQGSINIDGVYTDDFTPILVSDGSVSSVTVLATY